MEPERVRLLLLIPFLAAFAQAQSQPYPAKDADGARALLASPRFVDKAWGAYSAAQLRDSSLRAAVIDQLRQAIPLSQSREAEPSACIRALFDASIQLHAHVPLEVILPFWGRWRTEALILLAFREPGAEDEAALIKLREEHLDEAAWLAVNNLLFRQRSAALFRKSLEELRITHTFVVGNEKGGGIAGNHSWGGQRLGVPAGYPPTFLYRLDIAQSYTFEPAPDDVLLAKGPPYGSPETNRADVFYRGISVQPGQTVNWPEGEYRDTDRQRFRRAYLAALGSVPWNEGEKLFCPSTQLEWRSAPDFRTKAQAALAAQQRAILDFVAAASGKNNLPYPSGLRLEIVPVIDDRRTGSAPALPEIAAEDFIIK